MTTYLNHAESFAPTQRRQYPEPPLPTAKLESRPAGDGVEDRTQGVRRESRSLRRRAGEDVGEFAADEQMLVTEDSAFEHDR